LSQRPDPRSPTALTRTFFYLGPKSRRLFRLLTGVLTTHRNSPLISPSKSGNRNSRYRGFYARVPYDSRVLNPDMGQQSTLPVVGDFPIGKSAHKVSRFTCTANLRTPNSDGTCAISSPRHLLFHSIGNRGIAISPSSISLHCKIPNVESRLPGISCHLSPVDQRLRCDREIADRDFNSYENLASGKPDMPSPDKP
jgi:hypothetical protein